MDNKRKVLYDQLSKDYDLGDFQTFSAKLDDEGKRKAFYDAVSKDYDLGDYDSFVSKISANAQAEDNSEFEENQRLFAEGKPTKGVTTQSIIDAHPELGLQPKQYSEEVLQRSRENVPDYFKSKRVDMMYGAVDKDKNTADLISEGRSIDMQRANQAYRQRPITTFGEAFEQGSEALYQGGKNLVGEMANLATGSQNDYNRAVRQLNELIESGYSLENFNADEAMKAYKDREFQQRMAKWQSDIASRKEDREDMDFFEGLLHRIKDPSRPKSQYEEAGLFADEVQLARSYNAIQDALQKSNGNIQEAYKLLGQNASKETWGDKTTREARQFLSQQRPTEGFGAWVGGMIPQMVGNIGATAARFTPWGRWLTPLLGYGNMAYLTGATSGMSMAEARDYAERKGQEANEGEVWRTGIADAVIESATEQIPFNRYFGKVVNGSKGVVGKWVADAIKGNDAAANEMSELLSRASKEFGGGLFSGKNIKEYLLDISTEGLSEFTAEALQTITPMIYQNPEDYPTLTKILSSGFEGAKGGLFMGAFLGAGNRFANRYQDNRRREKQGEVTFAETKSGVFEILGVDKDGMTVAQNSDGEMVSLSNDEIIDKVSVSYEEFKNASMDKVQSDLDIQVEAENADIDSKTDTSTGMYAEAVALVSDGEGGVVEQPGNIVGYIGGQPIFVPEGMENTEENRIILKPGELVEGSIAQAPSEEVKASNEEMIRDEAAAQADLESRYAPEVLNAQMVQGQPIDTPSEQIIPISPMPEGNGWIVEVYAKDTNNKVAAKPEVREMTTDEFRNILQAQLDAEEATIKAEQAVVEEQQQVAPQAEEIVAEQPTIATEEADQPVVEEAKPQAPVIPTKQDGSIDFVAYGKEGSLKELGNTYGEKMPHKVSVTAKAFADDVVKAKENLDKANESLDNAPIGREQKAKEAQIKAQQAYEAVKNEADFWAEMDADIKAAQAEREAMLNPQVEVDMSEQPMTVDEFVAQQLANGNITLTSESFKKETGYGEKERKKFPKMFRKAENGGMSIERAGERLMEIASEEGLAFFDQEDANSGRDALINFLGSVYSWGDITGYVRNNREAMAKKESEAVRDEMESFIWNAFHMTPEEYATQREIEAVENPYENVDLAAIDAIFAEKEFESQTLNQETNESGRIAEGNQGESGILSEEQVGDNGGNQPSEEERETEGTGNGTQDESETTQEPELTQEEGESVLDFAARVAEEQRRKPLRERAREWSKALGVDVVFIEKREAVQNRMVSNALNKGEKVAGWFERANGKVYFYMPNLDNEKEIDNTYIHEVVAHKGVFSLLGEERFNVLCDKVWEMMPITEKVKFFSYPGVADIENEQDRQRAAADEYMAHLAEKQNLTPEEKTIWDNIVKAFRELLDKALNGIIGKSKLTDKDIAELIRASYANLKSGAEGVRGEGTRFSAKKKRALETASVSRGKHQPTVVSSADGANILNNLDNLQKEYEEKSSQSKTFLGDVAKAIEARKQGSGSQYATFETINGNVVTIRLADHNATVSNFDNRDENEGISIVVSAKDNNGITNDGDAHIVEYFYDSIDLRRADGKPLAEIVKSIKQSLYSGEFKDTTGLAERQEVNESRFRVVKDKNGKKSLVGLHNISESKLKKAIKQGGLANPSMAVIDLDKQSHVDYGDITLIAPSSLIDKKTGKNIGTYTADAWTPIYPNIEKRMSDKSAKAYSESLESIPYELRSKVRLYFNAYLEDGNTSGALNYWFLHDTGKNAPLLTSQSNDYTNEELDAIEAISNAGYYSGLNEEEKQKVLDLFIEKQGGKDAFDAKIAERIETMKNNLQRPDLKAFMKNKVEQKLQEIQEYGYDYEQVSNFYSNAQRAINNRGKIDEFRTFRNAQDIVNNEGLQGEFNEWLADKEEQFGVEEYLFVGYNSNGDRKYLPNTLENASKLMKKEGRAGATGLHGFNHFVATLAPNAGTLAQINKKKGNLSTQEEYDAFREKWGDVYHELAKQLQPDATGYADYGYYRLEEMPTVKNPKEYVKKEYGIELSDEFMKKYNEFVSAIKNDFPARYFETKFERPVYLNEFAAAVVPQGTSKNVVDALTEAGLPVEEYESGNNEARMAAVDKVSSEMEGVRFRFIGEKGAANLDKAEEATTRLDNLAVAREMESAEKDAKTIKMATGWERGADGLWRYEVADNLNFDYYANVDYRNRHPELARFEDLRKKLNSSLLMGTEALTEEEQKEFDALEKEFGGYKEYHNSRKLKDYLDAPELFDAYPELRNVELRFVDMDKGTLGKYLPDANTIVLNNSMKLSGRLFNEQVLVHEIQHAIQHIEGFELGANKNMQNPNKVAQKAYNREFMQKQLDKHIAERDELLKQKDVLNEKMAAWYDSHEEGSSFDDEMNEYNRQYGEIESKLEVADRKVSWDEKWLDATKKAKTELGEEGYAKVTGEVEARNVSRRMKMSDADRRNTLASETEDVAREDQIFLKDGIESGMRFRISDKARQLQAEVDKFTSKYNSKPVVVIDSNMPDKELKRLVGFEAKEVRDAIELGMNSGYNPKTDKIYIMTDNVKDSSDLEDSLFHENLHQYLLSEKSLVVEFFTDAEDAYKKNIKQIKDQGYKAYEVPEELFVRVVADSQVKGNFAKVFSFLSEEGQEKLTNLLKENGYDIARETEIRTSGRMDGSGRDGSGRRNGDDFGRVAKESSSVASPSKVEKDGRAREIRRLFDQVADNGLRGVVGDKAYDSAVFEMYRSLPIEAREKVAMDALNNYGADMGKAMDKFIGESYDTSLWDVVVGAIRNMLRKKGYGIRFSENDIRYLVWRNRQKLNRESILDVAEDIDTRYRLKVGEYEGSPTDGGDTPDGGGTRFKVKDGEKTVQNLRDHVASLKEEVANLKKEVRDLRKGSKEEWETKQRAIISFVKGRLTKEAGEELGKTRIEQILTLVTKASNSNDLHKPLQFIEQVINSAIIDSAAARMDKLIKTRLQGETNRGVAKGVVVDEATRRLFDSIRGTFKDLIATSIDSELRHVRGEILRFGKEINALPEDDTMNRGTLKKQQDALRERRKQLEEEQEELRKKNITETKEWITKRHDELVEAMDAHIEGNGVWTQEMQDEYDSLPLREKLAEIRESQSQMDAILTDALRTRREAYMNTGEARKRLLAEADMIESNYSIAQEELIKLMNEVSNELSEIIKGGKERLASRKQMLAERRRMIVGMGIDAVKKRKVHSPNDILSKEEKFHKWFDNSWLKKVSDFMTAPLNSFNFMLKYVDNNHTIGEGELYKHFMKSKEGALEANNRLYDGLKAYNTTIEEKVKEIFGKDIESVMKDSGKKHEGAAHKQYMYDSANHREGEMYPISISKGEALYVWLTWRQPDGYAKLIYDGWNEQSIAEIEELIGEQYMEFGEWVTDEFFPQLREDKYNKTHIEMFGTSMAKREHYFPFKVYGEDIQEKGEMGESYSGMPSTITGNIIKRTINKSRIDTEKNAFDLIFKYGNDMETWNAMAKLRQDLNFLHSSKAFRNYLEANSKGLFDKFIKSAEVAVKAYNNSGESNAINDFLVKFNRMWAGSNIGFRLNTAMKQILSYPAFTAYSGNPKYQANLAKYMLNWKGNYEWAKQFLPAFRNRIETGDMGMTGMSDPQFDLGKYIRKFSDAGMIPNQLVDALTCAAGARSVYDFEYDRAIKAGLTEEEAENIARYNAEIAFNETQQSSRDEFVSPIQISRNVLIKSMMNYQNSNVGYQRMGNEGLLEIMRAKQVYKEDIKNGMSESEAKKKMANSIARGVRKVVVAFAVLPGLWYLGGRGIVGITAPLISSLFGGGADDEPYLDDEAKEELLLSIALGTLAGTSGGQLIAGLAQGREYNPMAWMNEMQKDIVGAVKNGWNMNTTKNIALRLTKFGGVNIETFENIYLGVEHAIRTGNFDLVDFMMLINLPASQRKAMAEELYSDMPFMEYVEKVSRAQKLFDDYRKHLPYAKSDKTGSKKNSIKKQYIIENMDDSKQEELEKEQEFKKLKREYNSAEDKKEWLEDHPEYKELEKEYADQAVTKEVNRKAKQLK